MMLVHAIMIISMTFRKHFSKYTLPFEKKSNEKRKGEIKNTENKNEIFWMFPLSMNRGGWALAH